MIFGSTAAKVLLLSLYAIDISQAQTCQDLFQPCTEDCDCCGHPNNKAIRCEMRNQNLGKLCYEGRSMSQPCSDSSQCLSQNCVNGICVGNDRVKIPVPECPLGNPSDYSVTAVSGELDRCSCPQEPTNTIEFAMDGDLSTDYSNFHSQDYSGVFVEPSFKAPLRRMEICSSNQDEANDPLCYKIAGWCEEDNMYNELQSGPIPFTTVRQQCVSIKMSGRQQYSKFKVELGCRRGGYTANCDDSGGACDISKASCQEVSPKGRDLTCTPQFDQNGDDSFSEFVHDSVEYDAVNDVTKHTYSFVNKIGNGGSFPDLSHAVLQYVGGCCVNQIRVYKKVGGSQVDYMPPINSPGNHLQSPKPTVCMSGIDLPGVEGKDTFYYEFTIAGNFQLTTTVDYVLKGGQLVKYSQVQGPDCSRCPKRRVLGKKNLFRGLPQSLKSRVTASGFCTDNPVSISELKLYGKCNQG